MAPPGTAVASMRRDDLASTSVKRRLGQFLIVVAALSYASVHAVCKNITDGEDGVSLWVLLFLRGVVTMLLNVLLTCFRRGPGGVRRVLCSLKDKDPSGPGTWSLRGLALIHGRGMAGMVSAVLMSWSYMYFLSFSDTFALLMGSMSIITSLMATIGLGEKLRPQTMIGCLLSIMGTVFVSRPSSLFGAAEGIAEATVDIHREAIDVSVSLDQINAAALDPGMTRHHTLGIGVVILAGSFVALFTTLTRSLNGFEPEVLLHGYMFQMALIAFCLIGYEARDESQHLNLPSTNQQWLTLGVYILLNWVAQITNSLGFKHEGAAVGAVLQTSEMVFAFLLDVTFGLSAEGTTTAAVIGATCIFAGAVAAASGGTPGSTGRLMGTKDATSPQSSWPCKSPCSRPSDQVPEKPQAV